MLNLNDLHMFVRAVEHGGFAAASRKLTIPKSTISKRVAELERALDVRLIQRSSRNFSLTPLGEVFYRHAQAALVEAESAEQVIRTHQSEPSGIVRITASVPVAQQHLASLLPELAIAYPKLRIEVDVTDRFVDLTREGFDIALRSHFAPLPDSELIQRRIYVEQIILVASPAYFERHEVPQNALELTNHCGLFSDAKSDRFKLFDENGILTEVRLIPSMLANEGTLLMEAAKAGLGIAALPEKLCQENIKSEKLVRVLPNFNAGSVTTTLVMPYRRGLLPGVRTTADFLIGRLS